MESIEVAPQVWYVADWLSEADSERLLMKIDGGRWTELSALAGRRLQMHGGTPPPAPQPMLRTPLPDWLAALATRLHDQGRVPSVANHVLINEYMPEQGILPHEDGPLYEGHFAIVSLLSPLLLRFYSKRGADDTPPQRRFSLVLEPRSLLIVAGDAYTNMLHGIDPVREELVDDGVINAPPHLRGTVLVRQRRVSLTIRHVLNTKDASRLIRLK